MARTTLLRTQLYDGGGESAGQHQRWDPSQREATADKAVAVSQAGTAAPGSRTSNSSPTLHSQGHLLRASELTPMMIGQAGLRAESKRSCRSLQGPKK